MSVKESPAMYTGRPTPRDTGAGVLRPRRCDRATGHVLLVESDAVIADLLETILKDEGYTVERAATPRGALVALALRGPSAFDLVLSIPFADPLNDPYAWLDHLRTRTQIPIVICARCPALFYPDHRERGYAAFLEEPFELQQLIDLVAALCPGPATPAAPTPHDVGEGGRGGTTSSVSLGDGHRSHTRHDLDLGPGGDGVRVGSANSDTHGPSLWMGETLGPLLSYVPDSPYLDLLPRDVVGHDVAAVEHN